MQEFYFDLEKAINDMTTFLTEILQDNPLGEMGKFIMKRKMTDVIVNSEANAFLRMAYFNTLNEDNRTTAEKK